MWHLRKFLALVLKVQCQTRNISIIGELDRSAHSGLTESDTLGLGPSNLCFAGPLGESNVH